MMTKWKLLIKGLVVLFCILCSEISAPGLLQADSTAVMTLTAASTSIKADGISFVSIKATYETVTATTNNIPTTVIATPNVLLSFKTTKGTFIKDTQTVSTSLYTDADGTATVLLYSDTVPGTATVTCSADGVSTQTVFVDFTELMPSPASISLSASPYWIPSDGSASSTITADILDNTGTAVGAGTIVKFSTDKADVVFIESGKTTYSTVTKNATGTVTVKVHLTTNATSTGSTVITCTAGDISQTITVAIYELKYEVEPNNDMAHANTICIDNTGDNLYLGQLSSPYEEDWYAFTVSTSSRISINFLTSAIPKLAGDCTGSSTYGAYRVDIRDKDNNQLMSYKNEDCTLDNGIWETGIISSGTYYIVVYCPRNPDNTHYLDTPYYLAVSNNFYSSCGSNDHLVNSAPLSMEASAYHLFVPIINTTPYLWADLQYDPSQPVNLMFRVTNSGALPDLSSYRSCNLQTLSQVNGNYVLHIPVMIYNGVSYRVDLTYIPTSDGTIWFMLNGAWKN